MNFPLSEKKLEKDILKKDKREALRIGAIGIGEKALYLNSFYIDRMYYIPIEAVERVYKRVAMKQYLITFLSEYNSIDKEKYTPLPLKKAR